MFIYYGLWKCSFQNTENPAVFKRLVGKLLQWLRYEGLSLGCITDCWFIIDYFIVVMTISCMQRAKDQSRRWAMGQRLCTRFYGSNLCHYSPTGQWLTTAHGPHSRTGPRSPCRLNVEQHHDWDATSIHSPPLQQLWLTVPHTLFNPRQRAPRLSWKPVFLSECYHSTLDEFS